MIAQGNVDAKLSRKKANPGHGLDIICEQRTGKENRK